jgi:hypothetical protein
VPSINGAGRFVAACGFMFREARLLEQRLFAALFLGAPAQGVVDGVVAYRNPDGGFGYGLEPDKAVRRASRWTSRSPSIGSP